MLEHAQVTASLPAQDLVRARRFYADTLGLRPVEVPGSSGTELRFRAGAGEFVVFASTGRPSGTHTQMAFTVDDADRVASELRERGVVFADVEGDDARDGIATMGRVRGGWFTDSEGNVIGLVQELD